MSYTKRQFVEAAYEEIGIASYNFDLDPEALQSALRRLDAMMAEWNAKGIRLAYPLPGSPQDSDLAELSTVPDSAIEAIITNLGIRLGPQLGKTLSLDTKFIAKQGYNTLLSRACYPPEMGLPTTMPIGAGNKPGRWSRTFLNAPEPRLDAGDDSHIDLD